MFTLYQDFYNAHTDVIERDDRGNVIGQWADLISESNLPSQDTLIPSPDEYGNYAEITYAGAKPQIKINGSYKTVTLTYYSSQHETIDQTPGKWMYFIDDADATELVKVLDTESENIIKLKFLGDEEYLGKILTVKNVRDNITTELQLEIVAM